MNTGGPEPQGRRARSHSSTSTTPSSPLARRFRTLPPPITSPGYSSLSPSLNGTPLGTPGGSASYQNSELFDPAYSKDYLASPSSVAGSSTSTTMTTTTRFKRGHARKKAALPAARAVNPEELDLLAVEDPDDLFRLFGVRDLRELEERARDAAEGKVSELRTMVGERYRDLLSAADSIVRMRTSAEKLVERLDGVESIVSTVTDTRPSTPTKPSLKIERIGIEPEEADRNLTSPPTLSLTVHLFLSLPSLVHTLLEASSFLPAARLEGVGRVVYRELSSFSYDPDEEPGVLRHTFPIIEQHWESIGNLGATIARRATADLRLWQTPPSKTAETLAAIILLENASVPSSLSLLLDARSKSLSSILEYPSQPSKRRSKTSTDPEVDCIISDLNQVLGIILNTFQSGALIFESSPSSTPGILLSLLEQIEGPSTATSTSSIQLQPILSTLPNYALLARYLPPAILDFTPFLSITSSRNALSPAEAHDQILAWSLKEADRVVEAVKSWISDSRVGAHALARVRSAAHAALSPATEGDVATIERNSTLRGRLDSVIEERLAAVYELHLATLVTRTAPMLSTLISQLHASSADLDHASFLFGMPLEFPQPSYYALPTTTKGLMNGLADPFEAFVERVLQRVEGRTPLVDLGVREIEGRARALRQDLAEWLGVESDDGKRASMGTLRGMYVRSVEEMLGGITGAILALLDQIADGDIQASLLLGNFAFVLSKSKAFVQDVLLCPDPKDGSRETTIIAGWQSKLVEIQSRSLNPWRTRAIDEATQALESATEPTLATSPAATAWAWEESKLATEVASSLSPSQPSAALLNSLRQLVTAIRQVGPHRIHSDASIVPTLLSQYRKRAALVARQQVDLVRNLEGDVRNVVATQALWDVEFVKRFWWDEEIDDDWASIEKDLRELSSSPDSFDQSTLSYLQRTQTIFSALLPPPPSTRPPPPRMLPWGVLPSGQELKTSVGVVRPRARLGLLRE